MNAADSTQGFNPFNPAAYPLNGPIEITMAWRSIMHEIRDSFMAGVQWVPLAAALARVAFDGVPRDMGRLLINEAFLAGWLDLRSSEDGDELRPSTQMFDFMRGAS